jgi:hypothetical protein
MPQMRNSGPQIRLEESWALGEGFPVEVAGEGRGEGET